MELDIIQKKFFCVLAWHDVFRSKAALKRAYDTYVSARPDAATVDLHDFARMEVDVSVIERMFVSRSDVNKIIRKLINDDTFNALHPDKCSRFHVFKSKTDCTWHIEEQFDLFEDKIIPAIAQS